MSRTKRTSKLCTHCRQTKPLTEFQKTESGRWRNTCNPCLPIRQGIQINAGRKRMRDWYREPDNAERTRLSRKISRIQNPSPWLWKWAKKRATEKGLEFNIEVADVRVPKHCPILGIRLDFKKFKHCGACPSLDRINSKRGYVKGNVHVISHRANTIKSDATIEELRRVLAFMEQLSP